MCVFQDTAMSDLGIVVSLLVLGVLAWLWFDSLKAREAAIRAVRAACAAEGLLLLDATVAISGLKPARDGDGHLKLQRAYDFEYSDTGNNRLKGSVVLLGDRVLVINIAPRAAPTVTMLH